MKFTIALLIAMSVLACGLLDKDKKDSSEELKKKELELKERELALKEKEKEEKEERNMREREERLNREREDLSSRREYIEREERRNKDNQTRTRQQRVESDYDYSNYQPGLYPEASTRYLTYDDIRNKSKWQLKIMRNEIYARYGYIFKTKDMRNYFNSQSWYNPVYSDVSGQLTSLEKRNVAFIKKYE